MGYHEKNWLDNNNARGKKKLAVDVLLEKEPDLK